MTSCNVTWKHILSWDHSACGSQAVRFYTTPRKLWDAWYLWEGLESERSMRLSSTKTSAGLESQEWEPGGSLLSIHGGNVWNSQLTNSTDMSFNRIEAGSTKTSKSPSTETTSILNKSWVVKTNITLQLTKKSSSVCRQPSSPTVDPIAPLKERKETRSDLIKINPLELHLSLSIMSYDACEQMILRAKDRSLVTHNHSFW